MIQASPKQVFCTLKERPDLQEELLALIQKNWSPIVLASRPMQESWKKLYRYYPQFQLMLCEEDEIIAYATSLSFYWDKSLNELPDEGWDWLIKKSLTDFEQQIKPNYAGGLMIGIAKQHQGRGLSKKIIRQLKVNSKKQGLSQLIIPIRPTQKDQYPSMDMEEYMQLKKDGKIQDPWIRTHLKADAKIINVCRKSMCIEGNIQEWESWTGVKVKESGSYEVPGTLSLVHFNVEENMGRYLEPNIWICYD